MKNNNYYCLIQKKKLIEKKYIKCLQAKANNQN